MLNTVFLIVLITLLLGFVFKCVIGIFDCKFIKHILFFHAIFVHYMLNMLQETFFSSLELIFEENDSCTQSSLKTKMTYLLPLQDQMTFYLLPCRKKREMQYSPLCIYIRYWTRVNYENIFSQLGGFYFPVGCPIFGNYGINIPYKYTLVSSYTEAEKVKEYI